jgi:hypothetical protein
LSCENFASRTGLKWNKNECKEKGQKKKKKEKIEENKGKKKKTHAVCPRNVLKIDFVVGLNTFTEGC